LDVTATPATGTAAAARSVLLNPVALAWSLNMGVTLLAGFGLQLPRAPVVAVAVIAPALVAVATALAARPWYIPGVTGAVTSALGSGFRS